MAWFILDEASPYSASLRARFRQTSAVVPAIWAFEVTNVLNLARRRRRMTEADTERALGLLVELPVEVEAVDVVRVSGVVSPLASREQLTVYDAAYVEAAMRRGLSLATLDARLKAASQRLGVPITDATNDRP